MFNQFIVYLKKDTLVEWSYPGKNCVAVMYTRTWIWYILT